MTEKIAIMNKFTLEVDMQKAVQYHQSGKLEKAYKEMWKIFLAGEQPRRIEVKET